MSIRVPGSHSRGPLLGDSSAEDGLFEDLNLAAVDQARSPFKVWVENFLNPMVSGDLALSRATVTATGTAANTDVVSGNVPYLLLNAGTTANTGYNVQLNVVASNTATTPQIQAVTSYGNGVAGNNGRELVFFNRFGISSSAVTWDGAALLGMFVADTTLLDLTTLAPTIASAGGVGFHIGPTGVISYVAGNGAITSGTAIGTVGVTTASATAFKWYDCGFRFRQISTTTVGRLSLYFGPAGSMSKVASFAQALAAGPYFVSWSIINGAANQSDLAVESMVTALTRTPSISLL